MANRIAVIIPTRGNRREFLDFAYKLLGRQTRQPDEFIICDSVPVNDSIDIAVRYKEGLLAAKRLNCDLCICWEDDDWYAENYIEWMEKKWVEMGKPNMIGINHTIYYNIMQKKYVILNHPGRSSMMNMAVTPKVLNSDWCANDYAYLDYHLWTKTVQSKISIHCIHYLCVSIKHGLGMVGGGGHTAGWKHYNKEDKDWKFLESIVKDDVKFYQMIHERKLHI